MSVDPVSSITNSVNTTSASAASTTTAAATNTLSYDDFLSLLMTELQHQDPTQPMDPTQMVSQLATVSGVGQAVQTNKTLSAMLTTNSLSQAEALIGRTVTSTDGKTSGVVASVTVSGTGTTATLSDGSTVPLDTGATIPMTEGDVLDLLQMSVWLVVVGAGPLVLAAMAVGVAISLVQALTQIQEATLTFVPKLIVAFGVLALSASFIGAQFYVYTERVYARIAEPRP